MERWEVLYRRRPAEPWRLLSDQPESREVAEDLVEGWQARIGGEWRVQRKVVSLDEARRRRERMDGE